MQSDIVLTGEFLYEFSGSWSNHPVGTAHFHPFYEIYFLLEGQVTYLIDNERYDVTSGHFVCIPPNTYHNVLRKTQFDRKRMVVYFSEKSMNKFFRLIPDLQNCFNNRIVLTQEYRKSVYDAFHLLIDEKNAAKKDLVMIEALLTQILVMLDRECRTNGNISASNKEDVVYKHISEIIDYIGEHYSEDITLDTLSQNFFLNKSYISRLFKSVHGLSFTEYRNMLRLQQATKLLNSTKCTLHEIANKCGYKTANGFSAVFKAHTGFSPTAYRKRLIESDKVDIK